VTRFTPGRCLALLAALVAASACQVAVRRVPKPEPVATLRVAEVRRVADRVATSNATWSPDGHSLAFGTPEGVVAVGLDGTERRISPFRNVTWVEWSPAGRWVALLWQGGLWVVDLVRGGSHQVPLPGVVRAFRWSPAGDRGVAAVDRQGEWLWLVSAQGGLQRRVFGPAPGLYDLAWYPDGLYAFVRVEDERGSLELWRVRVAGPDRRRLASAFPSALQVQLAPTGRAVAYVVAEGAGARLAVQQVGRASSWTVARGARLWGASWSPQGDKLSYAEVEAGERAAVWVVDADGSRRLQVADYSLEFPDPGALVGTGWSPDGRSVAFGTGFAHRAGPVWVARLERR